MENSGGRPLAMVSCALILVAAIASAAAGTSRDTVVLWSANDQWVKIAPQDDPEASPNDHPVELAPEEINNALAALQIRIVDENTGAETHRPVFTREELHNLAPWAASGLAKAGPQQDVTFSTIGSHPLASGGLIKDVSLNTGRIFYDGGKLNVIFGELQSNYRKKNVYGQRTEDFTPRKQGSRDKAATLQWTVTLRTGVEFHSAEGGVRNDWVAIDSKAVSSETLVRPQTGEAAARQAAPVTGSGARKSSSDIEQRLQTLKELRDKGLITEEAYRVKMQELLSEL